MKKSVIVLFLTFMSGIIYSQTFTEISAGLTGVANSSVVWGDYDNDGDLDILLTGINGSYFTKLYRNGGSGVFSEITTGITGVAFGSAAWGDYDNDGDLDILLTGYNGAYVSKIYRNGGNGNFTDINAAITPVRNSSVAWGDYDIDGDLDILLTGNTGTANISIIYRNDGDGVFSDIGAGLTGVQYSSVAWGDYDNDGDLDILMTGHTGSNNISRIYKNTNGGFADISAGLTTVYYGSAAWGDYDNDGDLDILMMGYNGSYISKIFKNTAGVFADISAGLTGIDYGCTAWGDYDNDGDLDILQTGYTGTERITRIYKNDLTSFTDISAGLTALNLGSCAWADYDNDRDLDIIITGYNGTSYVSKIYTNNSSVQNSAPTVPANASTAVTGYDAVLSWDKSTDVQTPQNGLSYNIYISSAPGTCDTKSPMSNISTGYRKVVSLGNSNLTNSWTVKSLPAGEYYWSVQAVDNAYAGSTFASEGSFCTAPEAPVATEATNITPNSFRTNWNTVENTDYYRVLISDEFLNSETHYTSNNWSDFTGLQANRSYYYDVIAYNSSGNGAPSNVVGVNTLPYFSEIDSGLTGIVNGSTAWGDYDNDGDLDILISGLFSNTYPFFCSKIYRNDSGIFTDINADLLGLDYSTVAWGDYDNDGDLDVFISGYVDSQDGISIYVNNSGIFSLATNDINAWYSVSSFDIADYDNDGDSDLLLTGYDGLTYFAEIYVNNAGIFSTISTTIKGFSDGSVDWCDYDQDGDMDVLMTGYNTSGIPYYNSILYRNDSGVFTNAGAGLTGVMRSSADWGDYDGDGDMDILLTGYTGSTYISKVYRNSSGIFTDIGTGLTGVADGSSEWGDYDNDGDLDILLTGYTGSTYLSTVYKYGGGVFTDINTGMTGLQYSTAVWGDNDNDNDLDVLVTGYTGIESSFISKIYRNNSTVINTIPTIPSGLVTSSENDSLKLSFTASNDIQSFPRTLTYNIEILLNNKNITPSAAAPSTGYRKIVGRGNTTNARKFFISHFDNLPQEEKNFRWKVQAVDQCFAGSEFASSNNFSITSPRDLSLSSKTVMIETDLLKWEYANADQVDHYIIQLDDDPYFGSPIVETFDPSVKNINAIKSGESKTLYLYLALNELTDFGEMISNETYYWRVKPVYTKTNCVTIFSETPRSFLFNPTGTAPNPPVSGFNPSNDDIESSLPKLSWNNAVDPDGHAEDLYYICQLDTVNTFVNVQYADTTAAGITSIQVETALPEGYRYYYRAKTVDSDALQSVWSAYQTFLVVMPPHDVKITDDGTNVNLTWDAVPVNTKGVVYTVYSSTNPYTEFPTGWTVAAAQLTSPAWSEPHSASKKFYRITVGSSSK